MAFQTGQLVKVVRGTRNSDLLKVGTVAKVAVTIPGGSGARDHKGAVNKNGVILDNGKFPFVWNESRFEAYTPDPVNYATPSPDSPFADGCDECCDECCDESLD